MQATPRALPCPFVEGDFGAAPFRLVDPAGARKSRRVPIRIPAHQIEIVGGFGVHRYAASGPQKFCDTMMLAGRQTDMHIGAERTGHLFAQQGADGLATGTPQNFAHQIAECVDVIAMCRSRRPPGRFVGKRFRHELPVEHDAIGERFAQCRKRRAMGEHVAQRNLVFVVGRELRPQSRDGRAQVDQTALDQSKGAYGCERLADREDIDERIARPWLRLRAIRPSAPEIDDHAATDRHADSGARLAAVREISKKRVPHLPEARVAIAQKRDRGCNTHAAARV
jgi:hypothetical protein